MCDFKLQVRDLSQQRETNSRIKTCLDAVELLSANYAARLQLLDGYAASEGGVAAGGGTATPQYVVASSSAGLVAERVLTAGTNITLTDGGDRGPLTIDCTATPFSDEAAQDAIGTILADSSTIDFTYDDGTPSITASVIAGSLDASYISDFDTEVIALLGNYITSSAVITDHAIVRGDGGARGIQGTGITIDDSNNSQYPNGAFIYLGGGTSAFLRGVSNAATLAATGGITLSGPTVTFRNSGSTATTFVVDDGTGTPVNYLQVAPGATGADPSISVVGETNVDINMVPAGTGRLQVNTVNVPTVSSTDTLTNKTLTTPTIGDFTNATHNHEGASGGGQLNATNVFSAGTVPTVRLGSGTADSTTFLRGDQTWATPAGSGGVDTANSPNAGEWAKFTDADTIEGRTNAELKADLDLEIGTDIQAYDATLDAFAAYNTNGLITQTAANTFTGRTLTAGAGIGVTNGDGVSGNPTVAIETSGTVIARIIERMPPATLAAQEVVIAGTSTPAESLPALAFATGTTEYMDYKCEMSPQYAGGGLTIKLTWSAESATSTACRWEAALRRVEDDADDFNTTSHSYDYNGVDATSPSVVGEWAFDTIAFTDGADMDSVAAGETFILRIRRDVADDAMAGDAYLISVSIRET